ncbi:phospholipid carrier-dependent glycosyltransferase [Candidatus Kuenenbacteria bacterium]|nr:phospholipid carrier-dependent glycosyltransferase [Candidatus Kuenenbacteria bacterium]
MKKLKVIILLLLIIILGAILRLVAVFHSGSFWFDEVVSLSIAQKGFVESWQYLQWENNPPAHYWLLHFWIKIFGQTEVILRLSSFLFSILNIFIIYLLGRTLTKKDSVGLFAALLSAASSYHLFTSMDARMYPMLFCFFLLSLYFFWRYLESNKKLFLAAYIIAAIITLYTHLIGLAMIITCNLYWFYHYFFISQKKTSWRQWLLAQFLVVLAFLPWLINFITHNVSRLTDDAWYFNTSGSGALLFELPRAYFFLGVEHPFLEIIALLFFGVLFVSVFVSHLECSSKLKEVKFNLEFPSAALLSLLIFIIPLSIGLCLQIWVSKYYILGSPGLFLLLAMGFEKLNFKSSHKKIIIVGILFLLLPYSFDIIKNQGQHKWDELASYVEQIEAPGDIIFFPAFVYNVPFDYYYRGKLAISNILSEKLGSDPLLLAIKYNWYPAIQPKDLPDFFEAFKNDKRVILIYPAVSAEIHHADFILDKFLKSDWKLIKEQKFEGFFERAAVYIFKNPAL